MAMQFYYTPMSSATRVHWALEELGLEYEKHKLDLAAGDQKKPEYLALNPNGKIPLLVIDGVPIFESTAILIYLAERYGVEKGLFPDVGLARAEALKWIIWGAVTLGDALSRIIRNTTERFPAEQRSAAAGEAAKKELGEMWGIVDRALEGKEYLVEGKFTFADLALGAYVMISGRFGVDFAPYKNVQAWSGRCMARPAMGRAMQG
jgi:glutathione S-transferase